MKVINIILVVLVSVLSILVSIYLYKTFSWERIDILNIATLTASIIAIVALFVNLGQYLINKDKRLFELGEFRIEKYYKGKIARIEPLNVLITLNVTLVNKGRGYQLSGENLHYLQHTFIQYLMDIYKGQIPVHQIYLAEKTDRSDEIYVEFLNTMKSFYDGINNDSMRIINYHRQYLQIIAEIRKDKNVSRDQKTSFLSGILLKELLGYNMIIKGRATNNFLLVNSVAYGEGITYTTIGYLDLIKSFLPSKKEYDAALGEFKNLFERDLPK